jgi:hypothetical protein
MAATRAAMTLLEDMLDSLTASCPASCRSSAFFLHFLPVG